MLPSPMSCKKLIRTFFLLLTCALTTACMKDEPSQALFESYFRSTVNDYHLYQSSYEIVALERVNGWKQNEDYEIQGNAVLKSKFGYLELVDQLADQIIEESKTDASVGMGIGLAGMLRQMTGDNEKFIQFWNEESQKNAIPPGLVAKQKEMEAGQFAGIVQRADQILLEEYGQIIDRNLRKGDELRRSYTLTFKKTEKGWMGFSSR